MGAEQFPQFPPNPQFQPPEQGEHVKLKTPLGEIDASGKSILLIVILCCVCFTGFFVYELKNSNAADHKMIADKMEKSMQAVDELVYMQTLSSEEKARLKLNMPESLRRKVRNAND